MVELITEMLLYVAAAALLGLLLGYLIWGWGTAARISAARTEGATAARTSVDGSAGLRERLQECQDECQRQAEEIETLMQRVALAEGSADPAPADHASVAVMPSVVPLDTSAPAQEPDAPEEPEQPGTSETDHLLAPEPDQDDTPEPELESAPEEDAEPDTTAVATPKGLLAERPEDVDDLKRIKGVGKVMEGVLNAKGIYLFRQLAALDEREVEWVNDAIQAFPGRIHRDRWVEQAQQLYLEKYGHAYDQDA